MNKAKTARWVSRFVALAMVVVALLVFKVMEKQLKRIGDAHERAERRVDRPGGSGDELPQPATVRLPTPKLPGEDQESAKLDSKRYAEEADPSKAAREEALPEAGRVPEGAVW